MRQAVPARVDRLKEKMLAQPRYVSIEQALIITQSYKEHPGESPMMQRAYALRAAMEGLAIAVEPEELIVGNRTAGVRYGVVFPESGSAWVDREFETLPTRPQDRFLVREEDIRLFRREIKPFWQGKSLEDVLRARCGEQLDQLAMVVKINQKDHAQGHICPDCRTWLEKGPDGLRREALERLAAAPPDRQPFYRAVALVMEGASHFMLRYRDLLAQEAARPENAPWREDMLQVSQVCESLSQAPARTFHQALQSLWFLFTLLHMESNASSFSPGRLDRILWPYYAADLDAGRIAPEPALELIQCLFLKFNQIVYLRNAGSAKYFAGFPIGFNIALGGQDEAGEDVCNPLSFLFLEAQERLGLPQPNLSVRLHPGVGDPLLKKAIQVVSKGSGMPQFFNDKAVIPALMELGVSQEEARDYAIVGCVELTAQGCCLGWSDAAMFNLNKALELTLTGGKCLLTGARLGPDYGSLATYQSFEALESAFARQLDYFIDRMVSACEQVERAHMELLPTPFLSAVVKDCMDKGLDVTAGGARYNFSGIQMIQAANLADSLAALKVAVFEEKRVDGARLLRALEKNFQGEETLRARLLNKVPKYGNDVAWVDMLAAKWAQYFRDRLGRYRNYRGGPYHTGMYTVSAHVPMGQNVGATPDGRLARQPLADGGMSPVYGRDVSGPTAVLKSVSRLDKGLTSNGGLLNMKFLPQFFESQGGIDRFALFLRTFVDLEIPHVQFNVVSPQDLLDAKAHPENYRSLTVRVAGYTAYFTELAGEIQDEIIRRTSYAGV